MYMGLDILAQINATTLPTYFPPAAYFTSIGGIVNVLISVIMAIAGLVFGGMLLYSAYMVITAGGNPDNIETAKKTATYAILGIVIMFMAYTFVRLLAWMLNVDLPF
jgi:cell division protein FtsW (lipid II flippase)